MKKYKLIEDEIGKFLGKTMYRVQYLIDIPMYGVKAGDLGGYVENENNLSHEGNCCVLENALIEGKGYVSGDSCVTGNGHVFENGTVTGKSFITGSAQIYGNSFVSGKSYVEGRVCIYRDAIVTGESWLDGDIGIGGKAFITKNDDVVSVCGFGIDGHIMTFYPEKNGGIGATYECFVGTLEGFRKQMKEWYSDIEEYSWIADLVEKHFKKRMKEGK